MLLQLMEQRELVLLQQVLQMLLADGAGTLAAARKWHAGTMSNDINVSNRY
jgi:hypothetical protein